MINFTLGFLVGMITYSLCEVSDKKKKSYEDSLDDKQYRAYKNRKNL